MTSPADNYNGVLRWAHRNRACWGRAGDPRTPACSRAVPVRRGARSRSSRAAISSALASHDGKRLARARRARGRSSRGSIAKWATATAGGASGDGNPRGAIPSTATRLGLGRQYGYGKRCCLESKHTTTGELESRPHRADRARSARDPAPVREDPRRDRRAARQHGAAPVVGCLRRHGAGCHRTRLAHVDARR
jgi:hypothetical protein